MATKVVKKNSAAKAVETVEAVEAVETSEVVQEVPVATNTNTKRKFNDMDLIPCVSIIQGELFFKGARSQSMYNWAGADDIQDIEYRDLIYAIRTKDIAIFAPRFIIQDEDFLEQHPEIEDLYGGLYSNQDLLDILKLTPAKMKKAIESLPLGAKDSLKLLVADMIEQGTFDSIQRVKIIDEIFETRLTFKLTGTNS